jgi:hypothetical protein
VHEAALELMAYLYASDHYGRLLSMQGPNGLTEDEWRAVTIPSEVTQYVAERIPVAQRPERSHWPFSPHGGDPAKLLPYASLCSNSPITSMSGSSLFRDDLAGAAVLVLDGYSNWYSVLHQHGLDLPARPDHEQWRVDVVVKPIGWMGTYRRSRLTGRWFAGPHSLHKWGAAC